jgi:hypothetical protein
MRIIYPIIFFGTAIVWILYTSIIKKDRKAAIESIRITLFCIIAWGLLYYFVLK